MSNEELKSWNPMEEDFFCPKFNSYHTMEFDTSLDELCLYVKNIPLELSREAFIQIMQSDGRRATKVFLKGQMNSKHTTKIGFVNFATPQDSRYALNSLQGKPPLYLDIKYARKQQDCNKNTIENKFMYNGSFQNDNSSNNIPFGQGRGQSACSTPNNVVKSLKIVSGGAGRKVTMLSPEKSESTYDSIPRPTPHKQEYLLHKKLSSPESFSCNKALNFVDVNKQNPDHITVNSKSLSFSEKPQLIPNPYRQCLFCKQEALFSCGSCKKPYCSQKCQIEDWVKHKTICHLSKTNAAERRKDSESRPQDSSYVSEGSSSECEMEASSHQIDMLTLTPSKKELVKVCHMNDPSKFWIHRKETLQDLCKLEKEMSSINTKIKVFPVVGMVCCVQKDTKFFRVKVLAASHEEIVVYYLDYGITTTVSVQNLFKLPPKFFAFPAQAICCKLVDDAELESVEWSAEDTASFRILTETKHYTVHALRFADPIYEVSLLNNDGLSLFSILMGERNAVSCITPDPPSSDVETNNDQSMSIVSDVHVGSEVRLMFLRSNNETFFSYLLINGEADLRKLLEIDELLPEIKTDDASLSIEEMDYAAGYSLKHRSWYRCIILQRKQKKFLVRYIDYGDEEEIEKVRFLTPELLGIKSYLVSCDKPEGMSIKEVEEYFKVYEKTTMTVKQIHNSSVELCFNHKKNSHNIKCFPWHRGIKSLQSEILKASETVDIDSKGITKCPEFRQTRSNSGVQNLSSDKNALKTLIVGHKYKVKIVFIQTLSELYVQLVDDESSIYTLHKKLHSYCSSKNSKYVPSKNDVICCKFSDGVWYRGQILEENSSDFNVFFIDFGNTGSVPKSDVRFLPEEFRCPKFSICVSVSKGNKDDFQNHLNKYKNIDSIVWDMDVIGSSENSYEIMFFPSGKSSDSLAENNVQFSKKEAEKLPLEELIKVIVCYKKEQRVFIQLINDLEKVSDLSATLCTVKKSPINEKPVEGNLYCGLFDEDGLWYRVRVIKENANNSYDVDFIDYGNSKTLLVNDLRELPRNLLDMPSLCRSVTVQNMDVSSIDMNIPYCVQVVKERNGLQEVKFLDINATKELVDSKSAINSSCTVLKSKDEYKLVKFSSLEKQLLSRESCTEILITHSQNDIFYTQKLSNVSELSKIVEMLKNAVDLKCLPHLPNVGDVIIAKYSVDNEWYRGCVEEVKPNGVCEVLFFDYGNTETVSLSDMKIPPKEFYDFPILSIPIKFQDLKAVQKALVNNENIFSVVVKENKDNFVLVDITPPNVSCIQAQSLKVSPVDIKFSFLEETLCHVQQVSDVSSLKKLKTNLQNSEVKTLNHVPKVGELLRVKYEDGLWYRGIIKSSITADLYQVFFVDYGNTDEVKLKDICLLPDEDASWPMYSVPVIVQNLKDISEDIDIEKVFTAVLTDEVIDSIQVVKMYPFYESILQSSIQHTVLPVEEMCEVVIHHFDEKYYFAHRISDLVQIKEMNAFLQNSQPQVIYHAPCVNEVLLIKSKDRLWHRCVVKSINNEDSFKVFCFDSGVTQEVSKSNIFYVPQECSTFPMFAVKILLEEVETVNLGQNYCVEVLEKTSEDVHVVKIFRPVTLKSLKRSRLTPQKKYSVTVCHMEQDIFFLQNIEDQKLILELQEELLKCSVAKSISRKPIVSEIVCAKCSIDNLWYRGCVEEILPNAMYKILFIDYGNTEEVSRQNIQCLPTDLASYPSFSIPVKISNKDVSKAPMQYGAIFSVIAETEPMKGVQSVNIFIEAENSPKKENLAQDLNLPISEKPAASESDTKFLYSSCEHIDFPSGEQDIVIYFVINGYVFCAPFNTESIKMNFDLIKTITEYCKELPVSTYDVSSLPEENEMVLAKYHEDGQWYRAAVMEASDTGYDVIFVDFGNTEKLQKESLRRMPKQFMSLKIQAHLCKLTGFEGSEEKWPQIMAEIQQFTLMSEPLKAHVNISDSSTVNVPRITRHLLAKNLITTEDYSS